MHGFAFFAVKDSGIMHAFVDKFPVQQSANGLWSIVTSMSAHDVARICHAALCAREDLRLVALYFPNHDSNWYPQHLFSLNFGC